MVSGCRLNNGFLVLHEGHAGALAQALELPSDLIHVVGAGFDETIFNQAARPPAADRRLQLVYAGKYSQAKGLHVLLDAVQLLSKEMPGLCLHVAGTGAGAEAEQLRDRMERLMPQVKLHGQLSQRDLADLFRTCDVFTLPSFFEGLPLVVIEALSCGCRVVCSDLPGLKDQWRPLLNRGLQLVDMPEMKSVDQPLDSEVPVFRDRLISQLRIALLQQDPPQIPDLADRFGWRAVFERVELVWNRFVA